MNTPDSPDSRSASAIRRLTIAVWVLAAVLAVNVGVSVLNLLRLEPTTIDFEPRLSTLPPKISRPADISSEDLGARFSIEDSYDGFADWPLEKQVEKASVIAIARHEKDGDRYKAIISEILKKSPDTKFYYKAGDEYEHGGHFIRSGTSYGDGQIIFFVGSPASMRYSCTFTGERIAAFGDMPFEELRKMIKKE